MRVRASDAFTSCPAVDRAASGSSNSSERRYDFSESASRPNLRWMSPICWYARPCSSLTVPSPAARLVKFS